MELFLVLNGFELTPMTPAPTLTAMLAVAAGEMDEAALALWVQQHCAPADPPTLSPSGHALVTLSARSPAESAQRQRPTGACITLSSRMARPPPPSAHGCGRLGRTDPERFSFATLHLTGSPRLGNFLSETTAATLQADIEGPASLLASFRDLQLVGFVLLHDRTSSVRPSTRITCSKGLPTTLGSGPQPPQTIHPTVANGRTQRQSVCSWVLWPTGLRSPLSRSTPTRRPCHPHGLLVAARQHGEPLMVSNDRFLRRLRVQGFSSWQGI